MKQKKLKNSPGQRPNGVSDPGLSCCYCFSLITVRPQGAWVSKTGYSEPPAKVAFPRKRDSEALGGVPGPFLAGSFR